jgi:hypothetical protein
MKQHILPVEMSYKDAAIVQSVPFFSSDFVAHSLHITAPPTQALPARATSAELSCKYVAAAGISSSRSTALSDLTATSNPPVGIAAVNKVQLRRQPMMGVRNSISLPFIAKTERSQALLVCRFSIEVTVDDVRKSLKEQLSLKMLFCMRLKNNFD